ncbi:MAG: pentapeptide repeat-containing protein [Clostridiales bacterium]|nr:pentapeptide repeat-containing protein [Clostridiales bacterium]
MCSSKIGANPAATSFSRIRGRLEQSSFRYSSFRYSSFTQSSFRYSSFTQSSFRQSSFRLSSFRHSSFRHSSFRHSSCVSGDPINAGFRMESSWLNDQSRYIFVFLSSLARDVITG